MELPEHLWRFPTVEAISSLAARFGFSNLPDMQDWEYEVADPARIDDFLDAYLCGELSEDERFTLMETILQSFEEFPSPLEDHPRWQELLSLLKENLDLHLYTIWYWSSLETESLEDCFRVTPEMREIFNIWTRRPNSPQPHKP